MADKYSLREIINFAIEIEKEGIVFYEKMAKKTLNVSLKILYTELKNEEQRHKLTFEDLIDSIGPDDNKYIYHSENLYISYLHSFIEDVIFDKKKTKTLTDELKNDMDAVKYAIKMEEDSIKFYENMKELTPKANGPIIDIIISQENLHITRLLEVKKNIK